MSQSALLSMALAAALAGCGTEPIICSAELVSITATVVTRTADALPHPQVVDTVVRTGAVFTFPANPQVPALPVGSARPVVILSDDFESQVRPAGDQVVVTLHAGGRVARGEYLLGSDGCHVRKVEGPDSIAFQ